MRYRRRRLRRRRALPPETELAQRFGVNRHTVRERDRRAGAGRRAARRAGPRHLRRRSASASPIRSAPRTRFSTGLEGQTRERRSLLLAHAYEPASKPCRRGLRSCRGRAVLRLETLSEADGQPLSRATSHGSTRRASPARAGLRRRRGRSPPSFRNFGIDDYLRRSTVVSARHADAADLADLKLSPGAIVLVTVAINEDASGVPVEFSESRFVASPNRVFDRQPDLAPSVRVVLI